MFFKDFWCLSSRQIQRSFKYIARTFIIGGIFGTFLGIMKGLPELKEMNLAQVQQTQDTMKIFLERIAFSMGTSIIGIILSVTMLVVNTIFSPEKFFISTVDRFENALDLLWYRSSNNLLPEEIPDFDEHRDPIEAIREQKLKKKLLKRDSSSRYKISKTEKISRRIVEKHHRNGTIFKQLNIYES